MKDIEERLKQFLIYKKINSFTNINVIVQSSEKLAEFSKLFPELNTDWLINGRGVMLCSSAVTIPEDIQEFADMLDDIERISK